jgi:hypothetical protein
LGLVVRAIALMMEAASPSETSNRLHGATTQKTAILFSRVGDETRRQRVAAMKLCIQQALPRGNLTHKERIMLFQIVINRKNAEEITEDKSGNVYIRQQF